MHPSARRLLRAPAILSLLATQGCLALQRPFAHRDDFAGQTAPAATVVASDWAADIEPDPTPSTLGGDGHIQQVQHLQSDFEAAALADDAIQAQEPLRFAQKAENRPPQSSELQNDYAIDLPTALALGGANNLQIALAAEKVNEALARADAADVLWVPSLNAGLIYNNHGGRLQETQGNVIEVSRNSLFVGAGGVLGDAPLAGGSGGPARMFVDLPLVEVLFEPLAARQTVRATTAQRATTFNDTLLRVSWAYLELVQSERLVDIADESVRNASELVRLTENFAQSGQGLQADADRARVELATRTRDVLAAQEAAAVASAELARLLRLDPTVRLHVADRQPIPIDFTSADVSLDELIGRALAARPEIAQTSAAMDESWYRMRKEDFRPWIPNLYAGLSAGGFGGGPGSTVKGFSDRTDVDVAAIWEWENLGLGNLSRQRERESIHRQAHLTAMQIRELIAAEVTQAYQRLQYRRRQIDIAAPQVASARQALRLNLEGIRGGVLRPIEIQQAIGALAAARQQELVAIMDYNRAQVQLLRAVGQPLTSTVDAAEI